MADIEKHLIGNAVLAQFPVDIAADRQRRRAGELVGSDDNRSHGKEGVQAFPQKILLMAILYIPGADIVCNAVSK